MDGVILQVARRMPVHRRPLVLAVIVPLAATCLLTASLLPASQTAGVSQRQESVASLQERQRKLCEYLLGENLLDDPPADVDPAGRPVPQQPAAASAAHRIAVPFAVALPAGLPDTHESVLHFQPIPRIELRGPPRAATCG